MGVYELLDYHTDESFPNMIDALGAFRDGMECYRSGKWQDARSMFSDVLAMNPADKCSQAYVERCDYLEKNVKLEDWDGIWRLTSK